jgi:hypothetical protein
MTKSSGAISQTTNDKDIDNRIQELSNRLKVLNIEKASTEQQLRELENEKAERTTGRLRRNIDRARRRQSEADRKSRQAARDRKGELIVLGDRVRFLTKGFYRSTEGVVTNINKRRISARDNSGNAISRAPHNVEIIFESENSDANSSVAAEE